MCSPVNILVFLSWRLLLGCAAACFCTLGFCLSYNFNFSRTLRSHRYSGNAIQGCGSSIKQLLYFDAGLQMFPVEGAQWRCTLWGVLGGWGESQRFWCCGMCWELSTAFQLGSVYGDVMLLTCTTPVLALPVESWLTALKRVRNQRTLSASLELTSSFVVCNNYILKLQMRGYFSHLRESQIYVIFFCYLLTWKSWGLWMFVQVNYWPE